jgi:hypothetical protein
MSPVPGRARARSCWLTTIARTTAILLACGGFAAESTAATSANTHFESTQRDQLSENLDYETDTATDSGAGESLAAAVGDLNTTYAEHSYRTLMGVAQGLAADVELFGIRTHSFDMSGVPGTLRKWDQSATYIYGEARFSDRVTPQFNGLASPQLSSLDFIWILRGTYSQVIDIEDFEQPLYRLSDRVRFEADLGGYEVAPVAFDVTTYDPDVQRPVPAMWSLLDNDLDIVNMTVPGVSGRLSHLQANLLRFNDGTYPEVDLSTALILESVQNFLNDGAAINHSLIGNTAFDMGNSADLLGVIIRDETGTIRTDVVLNSANGVHYTILVPEPATIMLLAPAILALLSWSRRSARCAAAR